MSLGKVGDDGATVKGEREGTVRVRLDLYHDLRPGREGMLARDWRRASRQRVVLPGGRAAGQPHRPEPAAGAAGLRTARLGLGVGPALESAGRVGGDEVGGEQRVQETLAPQAAYHLLTGTFSW